MLQQIENEQHRRGTQAEEGGKAQSRNEAQQHRQREENERRRKQPPLPLCERFPFFSHVPTSPLACFRPCRFSLSYSPASAASASQRSISSVSFCSCASFSA